MFFLWGLSLVFARFDFLFCSRPSSSKVGVRNKEVHPVSVVGPTVKDSNSEYTSLFPTGELKKKKKKNTPNRCCVHR